MGCALKHSECLLLSLSEARHPHPVLWSMARVCWNFQLTSPRAALAPFLKLPYLQWPKFNSLLMGLFLIFKLVVFITSFCKTSSAAVQAPGPQSPMPGTVSWSLPGSTWICWNVVQPGCALGHTCSKHSLFPRPSSSLCTDPLAQAKKRPALMESSSPLSRNPNPRAPWPSRLGSKPPHSWIQPCLARLRDLHQGESLFSKNLFPWSPEKQGKLTKAGEAHKGRRG